MKRLIFLLMLFVGFGANAQYKLSFEKPSLNGNKFRVTLHMSADKAFSLGSTNFRFSYPTAALANPTIVSDAFPAEMYHETNLVGTNPKTGIVSVNTVYVGKAKANKMPITTKGKDLVELEFDVLDATQINGLKWRIGANEHPKTVVLVDDKLTVMNTPQAVNTIAQPNTVKFNTKKTVDAPSLLISNVMPNPVKDDMNVVFEGVKASNVDLTITDMLGRVVKTQVVAANKGTNTVLVNMSQLAPGTYSVRLTDGVQEAVEKVIKH
jgi:hypothetical protein